MLLSSWDAVPENDVIYSLLPHAMLVVTALPSANRPNLRSWFNTAKGEGMRIGVKGGLVRSGLATTAALHVIQTYVAQALA